MSEVFSVVCMTEKHFCWVCETEKMNPRECFSNQPLGPNTCGSVVKAICTKLNIRGAGDDSYIISMLLEPR